MESTGKMTGCVSEETYLVEIGPENPINHLRQDTSRSYDKEINNKNIPLSEEICGRWECKLLKQSRCWRNRNGVREWCNPFFEIPDGWQGSHPLHLIAFQNAHQCQFSSYHHRVVSTEEISIGSSGSCYLQGSAYAKGCTMNLNHGHAPYISNTDMLIVRKAS